MGRSGEVASLENDELQAGTYEIELDDSFTASRGYFCCLDAGSHIEIEK